MKIGLRSFGFIFGLMIAAMVYTACSTAGAAQGSAVNTDSLIQARRFVFIPQTVNPIGGRTRQLTADFFFKVTPDTVQSYLPYFGRAFTAPMSPGQGAMDFTLNNYEFTVTPGSKDRQTIVIRPRGGTDVREITLQIFPSGSASLLALSNNRQQISYNGYIQSIRR